MTVKRVAYGTNVYQYNEFLSISRKGFTMMCLLTLGNEDPILDHACN